MICRTCLRAVARSQSPLAPSGAQQASSLNITRTMRTQATRTTVSIASNSQHHLPLLPFSSSSSSHIARPASRLYSSAPAASASPSSDTTTPPLEKPDYLDDAESWIWDTLAAEFAPVEMIVRDVSGGCGSMYAIDITSDKFRGATMLKQQRMVNGVLGDRVKEWHGLQLRTKAP